MKLFDIPEARDAALEVQPLLIPVPVMIQLEKEARLRGISVAQLFAQALDNYLSPKRTK